MSYTPGFKVKIKAPFGPWKQGTGHLYRYSTRRSISVDIQTFQVVLKTYETACSSGKKGLNPFSSDLGSAITWADNYIAENFEVEKPAEERLKEAEAEIVTLKAKLAELEDDGFRFKIRQKVRVIGDTCTTAIPIVDRRVRNGVREYTRLLNVWYPEGQLEAV